MRRPSPPARVPVPTRRVRRTGRRTRGRIPICGCRKSCGSRGAGSRSRRTPCHRPGGTRRVRRRSRGRSGRRRGGSRGPRGATVRHRLPLPRRCVRPSDRRGRGVADVIAPRPSFRPSVAPSLRRHLLVAHCSLSARRTGAAGGTECRIRWSHHERFADSARRRSDSARQDLRQGPAGHHGRPLRHPRGLLRGRGRHRAGRDPWPHGAVRAGHGAAARPGGRAAVDRAQLGRVDEDAGGDHLRHR